MTDSSSPQAGAHHKAALRAEKLRFLFSGLPLSSGTTLVLSSITVVVLWKHRAHAVLAAWLTAHLALCGWRMWLRHRYLRCSGIDSALSTKYYRLFLASALLAGCLWGSSAAMLFPLDDVHGAFIAFMIAGVCSGAAVSLGADQRCAYAFIVPAVAPLIVLLFAAPHQAGSALGTMVIAYCGLLAVNTRRSHRQFTDNFALRCIADESQLRLAMNNAQLSGLLNAATRVSIIAIDLAGRIVTFNRGAEFMLGRTAAEMIGNPLPVIPHFSAELAVRGAQLTAFYGRPIEGFEVFVHSARLGKPEERVWNGVRRNGSGFSVNVIVTAINDEAGSLIGFLQIATDVTEQRRAEAEVALARAQLEAFVNYAPAAVAMFDRELRYIAHSQRWLTDYNLEGQSLIGRSHYEVFPEIPEHWKVTHRRCLAGAVESRDEDPFVRADGTTQWLRWEDRPWRDASGNIGGIVMLTEDITLRRAASEALNAQHELLRKLSDRVPGMIFQSRRYPDGRSVLHYTSEGIRDVYEIEPQRACEEYSILLSRVEPQDRDRVTTTMEAAIAQQRLWSCDYRVMLPQRGARWLHGEAVPEVQPDGSVLLHGHITDITERKKVERMKSEFVSTVSHELRTPLTSIQGSLGLLCGRADGTLPANALNLIDVARRNSARLVRLINDLLDMEKIDAGKLHFEIAQQQVMPLIEQSLEENAGYALAHRVRFELTRSVGNAAAMMDAHRFQQVMANLLSNAAKFSPPDAVVEVSAALGDKSLRIEVRDHGPGIPETFRDSIFQMFCQADATDARSKSGTGLGLAICKAIVEGMGGRIGFETQLGVGTLFYFELPAAPPPG